MSVFMLCERTLGLLRGNRLDLSSSARAMLESLNYEGLTASQAQEEAVTCARHFAGVRDSLFHTYPWVFARRTADLSSATAFRGWRYAYNLPADCLKLHQIVQNHKATPRYEQIGNIVGCDRKNVSVRYTAPVSDTAQWVPLFQDAFCARLAGEIRISVLGESEGLGGQLFQLFQFAISEGYRTGIIDSGLSLDNNMTALTPWTTRLITPTPAALGAPAPKNNANNASNERE
jgi:hypothetical protein